MDEAWRLWKLGLYPGNHLYGMAEIARSGHEVVIPPYRVHRWLARLGRAIRLGDLDQQFRALFQRCDIIYSASQVDTLALALLRTAGWLRRPLIATVHRPFRPGLERRMAAGLYARGHDRLICLGAAMERHMLEEVGVAAGQLVRLDWGVDLEFYHPGLLQQPPVGPPLILSAGKTARDYDLLIRAIDGLPCRLRILTVGRQAPHVPRPANVEILTGTGDEFALSYAELIAEYQAASVIAIPLLIPRARRATMGQTGLTSVFEAMAMGRPVVMTRNDQLVLDVEREGVGRWAGTDPESWRHEILAMIQDPEACRRMGERGRSLCERRYNMAEYALRLHRVFEEALGGSRQSAA